MTGYAEDQAARAAAAAPRLDPAAVAGHQDHPPRMGFFTDTSVCIGCKACEVACKEWNLLPEDGLEFSGWSYDNTKDLGATTWRQELAPSIPVLSIDMPRRLKPSSGTSFHSLQATSHALQPMHTEVSVKNPIRGGASA